MSAIKKQPSLKILLAAPRGFCAGVDRAIQIVERVLEQYGAPVYVRHEIVHNRFVVESLEKKGAIFVDELDNVPEDRPVVFSAHGVPKSVPETAKRLNMFYIDATCPLVSKVHREAVSHYEDGAQIVLIGHKGHPEVIGTLGQIPSGQMILVENTDDVRRLSFPENATISYVTQTTLSVDDTTEIIDALKKRFPDIASPKKEDICYATTNRQEAVKAIAPRSDMILVIGAPNSSNSNRLVEVAKNHGCCNAYLIQTAKDIAPSWLSPCTTIGLTAGASAPEILVEEVLNRLRQDYDVFVEEIKVREENVSFKIPKVLLKKAIL